MAGIGHALAGFSVFSLQDASVKWLAGTLPIWEILFFRSVMILVLVTLITGPRNVVSVTTGPSRNPLLTRSGLILIAWLAFFTASRSLHLAELVTIYFATPIFVVILSIVALKETVGPARWVATLVGFAGVLVASGPSGTADWFPVALTLFAACCWAWTNILIRRMSQSVSTLDLMIASSALFTVVCGSALPFIWVTPDLFSLCLMVGLGFVGGVGQYLLFEGYRLAPASAIAPFEYVTLIWAFIWGFLVWADVPTLPVLVGAGLIMASGLGSIWVERRRHG